MSLSFGASFRWRVRLALFSATLKMKRFLGTPVRFGVAYAILLLLIYGRSFWREASRPQPQDQWRPTHFMWNQGIALQADIWICDPTDTLRHHRNSNRPPSSSRTAADPLVIYVCSPQLRRFASSIVATELPAGQAYVLVSGDSDHSVPSEMPGLPYARTLVDDPRLLAWWAQNLIDSTFSEKLRGLPIGLDLHTRAKQAMLFGGLTVGVGLNTFVDPRQWLERTSLPQAQEEVLLDLLSHNSPPASRRELKVYADFQYNAKYARSFTLGGSSGRMSVSRAAAVDLLADNPSVVWGVGRKTRRNSWLEKSQYAFELSLPGNGVDCHRTWEALILGSIVLTVHSPLDPLFRALDLPVVILEDLSDITPENLKKWLAQYSAAARTDMPRPPLTLQYWWDRIQASKRPFAMSP